MEEHNCKYNKIISLLEKRIDTMSSFIIVSTGIFIIEQISLLFLIYILLTH